MVAKKWMVVAGAVLLSGALVTGVAFAAERPAGKMAHGPMMGQKPDLDQLVKEGKITQAEADVLKQLQDLRQKAMAQLKTDAKAVIDQAVKDGKLTQEQADRLTKRGMRGPGAHGKHGFEKGKHHHDQAQPSKQQG
jgi:polyhydroxyalkanoate synthesis regulator phasin